MPIELSIANDGSNETVVIKKRLRVSDVSIRRGGAVTFSTERVAINNADDTDRTINSGPQVTRQVESILAQTVTIAGQPVAFQTIINALGKFHDKWRAEDIAAQTPPL